MPEDIKAEEKIPKYDPSILPDMLPVYYKRLFPHKPFYRWLSYGLSEGGIFANREFSYTLHDDIYIRYRCYDTQSELENDICTTCPHKIDIGPVMNTKPKNFRITSTAMQPVQRELVFDIDMDDYNEVRTCCTGSTVCLKCWKFMALAARLLDAALREDFGFEHILWVFSGRRGVHGWVCDYDARHLDSRGRSAVAEYLQISTTVTINGVVIARVQNFERMHHSVRRALKFVEPLFDEIVLEDQNLFGDAKGITKLLMMIPDETARNDVEVYLKKTIEDGVHSRVVWASFVRYANSMRTGAVSIWTRKLKNIVEEIQLGILYPRLDINVTKGMNHLLKSPFCIHPGTGKVCVPFNCHAAAKFDPTTVPNIAQLLQEINAFDDKSKNQESGPEDKSRIKDYKKTSMFKGVVVFEEFLRKLETSLKAKAIDVSDKKMEF
ncbi:PREDICTED: DNA primase small subunit [Rhagoletis zephyria]|uniref:DNA primase small subunit n=1 Tax=Rhagoletis zephyria TaxID=28612 RepID=UPI00081123DC|nr:PREDICTED: DNA primase small subunit [Rhagoletis zephyria]XP_017485230.1 PREDICTED: DNA primase small subunit [Rhagoletis zephyria]XP_017485231.1 PREDICTED: DNA primase small subunit [Rhagoletis zephyria]XP_017485232.1 PREDICTED: DNA primase small subunit [Rhagoletis zephyria]XP_017485233.1 PREDICTED: DNA primase small subunit [Rhagoletis zephyria]XP_017485234.1 PREDICTED: DNA primase small subunit [Rhagoletis zephyria]XP_017485235.1 PREDICTED: DNA primase small subunit [Rhagoletis zephyri